MTWALLFLSVAITASNQATFRGFFTQSRASTSEYDPSSPFIGTFLDNPLDGNQQLRPCDNINVRVITTIIIIKTSYNYYSYIHA